MITAKEAEEITNSHKAAVMTSLEYVENSIRKRACEGTNCAYFEWLDFGRTNTDVQHTIETLKGCGYKVNTWGENFEVRW